MLVDGVTKLGQIPWTGDGDQADPRAHGPGREPAQDVPGHDRRHRRGPDQAGRPPAQHAHARRTCRARSRCGSRSRRWRSTRRSRTGSASGSSSPSWKISPSAISNPEAYAGDQGQARGARAGSGRLHRPGHAAISKTRSLAEGIEAELDRAHASTSTRSTARCGRSSRTFDEIYDVIGIRCIIPDDRVKDCYGALGIIHSMWHPIPGEFDDYIATPKQSMYQSLHTAVIGPEGRALEIQIRTRAMHEIAEFGVAAHWRYKEGKQEPTPRSKRRSPGCGRCWSGRPRSRTPRSSSRRVKSDVLEEMIYVFTPKGDIIELPAGATPLDFAYRIHTEVGHHTRPAPRSTTSWSGSTPSCKNGQVVEISTSKTKLGPSRDWLREDLGYITTASAKEKIRQWFRRQERDENIAQGKEILEQRAPPARGRPQAGGHPQALPAIQQGRGHACRDRLRRDLAAVDRVPARRDRAPREVLSATPHVPKPRAPLRLDVMGVGDLLTYLATCCKPVNGDAIVGYVTRGRGITVHRADCPNIVNLPDPERLIQVTWGVEGRRDLPGQHHGHAPGTGSVCSRTSARCWPTRRSTSSTCRP